MDDVTLVIVEASRPDPSGSVTFAFDGADEEFICIQVTLVDRVKSLQATSRGFVLVNQCASLGDQYRRFLYGESGDFTITDDDGAFSIVLSPLLERSQARLEIQMKVWFHDGEYRVHLHMDDLFTSIDGMGALMAKLAEWGSNR